MLNALYISTLGMHAQKMQIDAVSNNLVNANTPGFKRERVEFSSILDRQTELGSGEVQSTGSEVSRSLGQLHRDLSQGQLRATDSALDLAINGAGFLEVQLDDQRIGYVRGGSMSINADGYLTTSDGRALKSDVRIPSGATQLHINAKGVVTARINGEASDTELGRLQLVAFANPESLNYLGGGVYESTSGTADPVRAEPGSDGLGSIESGKLEISNVKLVDEMVSLMLAQRVYELNSRVIQAADEVMGLNNSLRKG